MWIRPCTLVCGGGVRIPRSPDREVVVKLGVVLCRVLM
jgi:hypothetical protein